MQKGSEHATTTAHKSTVAQEAPDDGVYPNGHVLMELTPV
jgi:hypothetical protein